VERDAVERDAVERDAVERDAVERDAVERDAVERDAVREGLVRNWTRSMRAARALESLEKICPIPDRDFRGRSGSARAGRAAGLSRNCKPCGTAENGRRVNELDLADLNR
jgi:hypothetical protein